MKKTLFILFTIILSIFLSSCNEGNRGQIIGSEEKLDQSQKIDKPVIYTSFYPIYFLTKSLVGENAEVINLVPAGGEPHDYEPTIKQISLMQKANLIILNGLGIEEYEEKLLESIKNVDVIMVSENLKNLINIEKGKQEEVNNLHNHGNIDPHTWLSPKVYKEMVNIIINELEKKGFKNLDKSILVKLDTLNNEYSKGLKDCNQKQLVTSHEAFGYLARDYGLIQHAVFGISPEEEPSANDISSAIDLIEELKLNYIFSEEFVSPKFAETIKKETGVSILNLHPLETISEEEDKNNKNYISIMEKNLEYLKTGLECR